jgi:hypothetical protein
MYGLPKDFDTSFLLGKRLELVCFSENTVNLHFDEGLLFTIESGYIYEVPKLGSVDEVLEIPVRSSNIMRILGVAIVDALARSDGTLVVTFENGNKLTLFDPNAQYESYRIDYNNLTIIV